MFDTYVPVPAIACAWCGGRVDGWQGKDGPCVLAIWTQGERVPINDPGVAEESQLSEEALNALRLPSEFWIYDWCERGHMMWAQGRINEDGIWVETDAQVSLDAVDIERQKARIRGKGFTVPGTESINPRAWRPGT
jgi:hypothetical protein